eukprot:SAG31_NODE_28026_length_416_cov_1.148265_1_plen_92_part_10
MVFARFHISVPMPLAVRSSYSKVTVSNRRCVLRLDEVKYTCFNDQLPMDGTVNVEFVTPVSMLLGRDDGEEARRHIVSAKFPNVDAISTQQT